MARVNLPLIGGRRVASRSRRGGGPASFLLTVPGIASFAKDALSALAVVTAVGEVASWLVALGRGGGRVDVLHLNR